MVTPGSAPNLRGICDIQAVAELPSAQSHLLPLYLRSPMARDRLRLPLTRVTPPMSLRKPPAAMMRERSTSEAGLWSSAARRADS